MQLLRLILTTFCNFCATFLEKIATFAPRFDNFLQLLRFYPSNFHLPLPRPSPRRGGLLWDPRPGATRCLPTAIICRPVGARGRIVGVGGAKAATPQGCQEDALQIPQGRSFYLSLTCLFGALACYLSFLAYPLSHTRQTRPQLRSLRNLRSIPTCTALRR